MSFKHKLPQKVPQIEVDLTGPNGNVVALMKLAKQLSHKLGFNGEKVVSRMMRGSYKDALKVFDAYFGDYVTMYVDESIELN